MEALMRWWRDRLSRRERRALAVLAVIGPTIILWFMVTRPLLDRREALERAGRVLEQRTRELEPLLLRADGLAKRGLGVPSAVAEPLPMLEACLAKSIGEFPMPELTPFDVVMGEKRLPGARIRCVGWRTGALWRLLARLEAEGWLVSEFEVTSNLERQELDGILNVWKKKVSLP